MPFEITWEPRGVYRRYFGAVTIAERRQSFDRICADARFDDLRYSITDYRDVENYEITDESTEELAALHIAPLWTNPHIIIAVVVSDDRIIASIRHFISLKFTSLPYRIFSTVEAARRWVSDHASA